MSVRCHIQTCASYSITSSALDSSVGDTSRPSDLAVLRFSTSSNLVGCSTGRSARPGSGLYAQPKRYLRRIANKLHVNTNAFLTFLSIFPCDSTLLALG